MDPSTRRRLAWERVACERVQRCRVFDLDRVRFRPLDGRPERDFFVVEAPDWINVIPLTAAGRVVLIRQYRFGVEQLTWEIPGGMVDPGEAPQLAAARELREETGYGAAEFIELGWVHPNPAIQNNRCYTYLAQGAVRQGEPEPDANESFEVVEFDYDDVLARLVDGTITHALVVSAFQLLRGRGLEPG